MQSTRLKILAFVAILALLAIGPVHALTAMGADPQARTPAPGEVERGRLLVRRSCAGCHATEASGASLVAAAPPLRELHARYPGPALGKAVAEGILIGHPMMPDFQFSAEDIRAVISYLEQLQTRQVG